MLLPPRRDVLHAHTIKSGDVLEHLVQLQVVERVLGSLVVHLARMEHGTDGVFDVGRDVLPILVSLLVEVLDVEVANGSNLRFLHVGRRRRVHGLSHGSSRLCHW